MREGPVKGHRTRGTVLAAAAVAMVLVLAACTGPKANSAGTGGQAAVPESGPMRVAVVTHSTPGDAFWNAVKNGAEAAGKQLDVEVTYTGDGDPANQAKLIDNAVAQRVSGLVVSMANPDALRTSVTNAVKAGIPVVTINSGEDKSAAFGAIGHVGQSEAIAGERAGAKFKAAGKKKLLCVIHEAGNVGANQRCQGAKQGFGAGTQNLQVDINNPTAVQARIRGAVQADPGIDAILTLNAQVAALAVSGVKDASSKAVVGTFDLNPDVITAIKAGSLTFAVDQQQYEQGYLPIVMLKLYRDNGNTVGGGRPVQTGPAFVEKSNVDQVEKYAKRGTR